MLGTDDVRTSGEPLSDEPMLARLHANDRWAWEELYDSLAPDIRAYVRRIGAVDPDDILGETMVQVVRDLGRFRGSDDELRAWVFRIARNRVIDAGRRRSRRPKETHLDEELAPPVLDADPDPAAVSAILDLLTEDQREAVWLRHVLDLSVAEAAVVMGRDPAAVAALTHRGLQRLRRLLGPA